MSDERAIRLNQEYAEDLGWSPVDWGCDDFDEHLVDCISAFQASFSDLVVDGICGPMTHRRLLLDMELDELEPEDLVVPVAGDNILVMGELKPIAWDRVVTPGEEGALELPSKCYRSYLKSKRKIDKVITHWDVTTRARKTFNVLRGKKISTHFVIDWDGTIYQFVDTRHETWHAGIGWINRSSVGIDFNTPVHTKYNAKLVKLGQPERPVVDGWRINGWNPGPFLGMHQVQLDAYAALLAALHLHCDVPLEAPAAQPIPERMKFLKKKSIGPGVYHHGEVDYPRKRRGGKVRRSGKWDTAGVVIPESIREAKKLL